MLNKKKIVILSQADFAGSAYQVACAINSVNRFEVRAVTMSNHAFDFPHDVIIPCHPINHPGTSAMNCDNYELVMQLFYDADIIHCWNDIPEDPDFEKGGIYLSSNKPMMVTMTGSLYRNEHPRLNSVMKARRYKLVVQNPMLKYPYEIDSIFIPDTVDTKTLQPLQNKNNEKFTLGAYLGFVYSTMHFDWKILEECIKGKDIVLNDYKQKTSWKEHTKIVRNCDAFYHGIEISKIVGYIGRSSLEAMAMGVPVITYVNEKDSIKLSEGKIGNSIPVLNASTLDQFKNYLDALIKDVDLRKELGAKGREWVEKYFSFEVVGNMYSDLYAEILK